MPNFKTSYESIEAECFRRQVLISLIGLMWGGNRWEYEEFSSLGQVFCQWQKNFKQEKNPIFVREFSTSFCSCHFPTPANVWLRIMYQADEETPIVYVQLIVGVHEIPQKQRDRNAELSHGSNKKCFSYLLCQWATIVYPNSARIWSTRELITANIRNRSLWIDWWVISGSQQQHVIGILDMYGGSGCVVPGISLFVVVDSFVRPFHQRRRQPWALDSNRMISFPYHTST